MDTKEQESALLERIDRSRLPAHIAIIMDGNGRWAVRRGMPRISGHVQGRHAVRRTVEACRELGVRYLTLYTFSVENWRRPREEVDALMSLIELVAREETEELHRNNVHINVIGRAEGLPQSLLDELRRDMAVTAANTGMVLNLAINYGGRAEIVDAVRKLMSSGATPEVVDENAIASALYTAGQPDPDLLIRTAGEQRLSNFLLWQMAYSEIYVTDVLWPDFDKRHLYEAILDYQRRTRKFGGLESET
ncbi:MAG: isoprenyl transferase [Armatimonadota bacterium]